MKTVILGKQITLAILMLVLSCGTSAHDVTGSKDHTLFGRFAGSEIHVYKSLEFDEFPFITGPYSERLKKAEKVTTVEGKLTLIGYRAPEGASLAQLARNFKLKLEEQGFSIEFECDTKKRTCSDGSYGQPEFAKQIRKPTPLPGINSYEYGIWNYRFISAKLDRPEGPVFASLWITDYRGRLYVYVSVLEQEAMAYKMVDASKMAKSIAETGHIALYGIYFDSNKTEVKPDSKPTLEEIAKLLKADPELELVVVGHTDNQGAGQYNMDLSKRRAASVVDVLVKDYGIAAKRLSFVGVGYLSPVASNESEDGRAKNRRVELVKK
jgi:outer membrane protein OmpA-like peptidoglycan-associated protein